jgi:hypothetical protein
MAKRGMIGATSVTNFTNFAIGRAFWAHRSISTEDTTSVQTYMHAQRVPCLVACQFARTSSTTDSVVVVRRGRRSTSQSESNGAHRGRFLHIGRGGVDANLDPSRCNFKHAHVDLQT